MSRRLRGWVRRWSGSSASLTTLWEMAGASAFRMGGLTCPFFPPWGRPASVSYTHLDVYKRQLLEHANDEVRGTRTILSSPLGRFFMCNENFHREHHLFPGVPWHHLPQVHAALAPSLRKQGAPYIRSYSAFVREFFIHSLRRSPLGWKASKHS